MERHQDKTYSFRYQVEHYHELSLGKSYRGSAGLLMILFTAVVLMAAVTHHSFIFDRGALKWGYVLTSRLTLVIALLFAPLSWLVFKGRPMAIALSLLLWTIDRSADLVMNGNLVAIIWWLALAAPAYYAFRIERAKRKNIS